MSCAKLEAQFTLNPVRYAGVPNMGGTIPHEGVGDMVPRDNPPQDNLPQDNVPQDDPPRRQCAPETICPETTGLPNMGGDGGGPPPMKGKSPPIKACPPPSKKI